MSKTNKTADDYVLDLLKKGPVNTYDMRKKGVFSPAGSISRLRKNGYIIDSVEKKIVDDLGIHRKNVAEYHLNTEKGDSDE